MDNSSIKSGDFVRSFDFEDRDLEGDRACYVEGEVTGFQEVEGCNRYAIRITKRVRGGAVTVEAGMGYVYPPVNGIPKLFGGNVTDGVEKIEKN